VRTGLLIEYDNEQGIEYLRVLLENSVPVAGIIFVGHQSSAKSERLLRERTGGLYEKPPLSKVLSGKKIPAYFIDDVNSPDCAATIGDAGLDLLVSQSSKIIRVPIYDIPRYGILNCHTAILPYLRGCSCLEWSIYNDHPMGATCHYMVRKVDSGPIVSQSLLKYRPGDTYETIRTKMIYLMAQLIYRSVEKIARGQVVKDREQPDLQGPWFSPMRDGETVQAVKDKLIHSRYDPSPFANQQSLDVTDIDLAAYSWSK
jgi:methionyl-tRNA formyltransferase